MAVILEFGFNATDYGKTVLAACIITDLATVLALGFIFAPFTSRTLVFFAACGIAAISLPWLNPRFFKRFGGRPSELEAWRRPLSPSVIYHAHCCVLVAG